MGLEETLALAPALSNGPRQQHVCARVPVEREAFPQEVHTALALPAPQGDIPQGREDVRPNEFW